MRKYLKFHGINIENGNGLPVFTPSPEAAMASMPDGYWNALVDPGEVSVSPARALQRVTGQMLDNIGASVLPIDSFPNGAHAFDPGSGNNAIGFVSDRAVTPDKWTVFSVIGAREATVVGDIVNVLSDESSDPETGFRISISSDANNLNVYQFSGIGTGEPIRLQYALGGYATRTAPMLLMVTFSTERGLAIWDNGVQVAYDPEDRQPLETGFSAGQWRIFRLMRHMIGLTGQLNADLGLDRNAAYRRMIERHCKAKYGIDEIPE